MSDNTERWTIMTAYDDEDTFDEPVTRAATVRGPEQREPIEVMTYREALRQLAQDEKAISRTARQLASIAFHGGFDDLRVWERKTMRNDAALLLRAACEVDE